VAAPAETRAFRATVQGVGFRWSAVREARSLGIRGTVRNTAGGDVEVYAEADPATLQAFIDWLRQGPSGAHVHGIDLDWVAPEGMESFEVVF
jgi:acylphosphatase